MKRRVLSILPISELLPFAAFLQLLFMLMAPSTAALAAGQITVTIPSMAGPWSQALNPSFNYGVGDNAPPVVIDSSSGISFTPGATITVRYISGLVSLDPNPADARDANGEASLVTNFPYTGSDGTGILHATKHALSSCSSCL
jgi:hypothetical protein